MHLRLARTHTHLMLLSDFKIFSCTCMLNIGTDSQSSASSKDISGVRTYLYSVEFIRPVPRFPRHVKRTIKTILQVSWEGFEIQFCRTQVLTVLILQTEDSPSDTGSPREEPPDSDTSWLDGWLPLFVASCTTNIKLLWQRSILAIIQGSSLRK